MGGYGGALKQLSIGCASSRGKKFIHGFGSFDNGDRLLADFTGKDEDVVKEDQIKFTEAMADAASSVHNFFNGNIVYINIMSNISRDCDCDSHAEAPCMKDIGILISKDPVAIDQACLDLVYNSNDPGKDRLIQRIESRFGTHILDACENIGFGNRNYNLIVLDKNNKIKKANINTIYNIIDNSNCKNIIFDLGGVLLKDNKWRDLVKNKCKDLTDKDIDLFVSIYEKFLDKSDTASLNNARMAFISNFENEITKQKALRAFNVLIDTVDPFEYTEDLLKNLQRKGYKLYYLSNWSNYGFNAMKSHGKLDFLKYFNGGLVSYEVGFMKPDIEIYNLFLDKMKIKPKDCIFFDDKYDNIKSAKSIGINGYIWSNLDK
jgi:epoxide hydrolase-like predicted phosphatase